MHDTCLLLLVWLNEWMVLPLPSQEEKNKVENSHACIPPNIEHHNVDIHIFLDKFNRLPFLLFINIRF